MTGSTSSVTPEWNLAHLQTHLQDAINLELWTIPYYMSAMYSIKDPACEIYKLMQSVVYQEMLHTQLACNLSNAFGCTPVFRMPVYGGPQVPHLNFNLDDPNPTEFYSPYSTEIGPLDEKRINTLCLIEYPEWRTGHKPSLREDRTQYGSIGEFYAALRVGITELKHLLQGDLKQVDFFGSYYNQLPTTTITHFGEQAYRQAMSLIDIIVEQGEGQTQGDADIQYPYRNTADGYKESWSHFRKFTAVRDATQLPETYEIDAVTSPAGHRAQVILSKDFAAFIHTLTAIFNGEPYQGFGSLMAKLGGDILNCWQHKTKPKFS